MTDNVEDNDPGLAEVFQDPEEEEEEDVNVQEDIPELEAPQFSLRGLLRDPDLGLDTSVTRDSNVTQRRKDSFASVEALRAQINSIQAQLEKVGIQVPITETPQEFIIEAPQTRTYNDLVSQARRKSLSKPRKTLRFSDDAGDESDDEDVMSVTPIDIHLM